MRETHGPHSSRFAAIAVAAVFAAFSLLLVMAVARAVPRYSARYEQNCNLCHVNPTGGGMRNLYATQYIIPEELALKTPNDDILEGISPEIATNLTIGTDFRMQHIYSDDDAYNTNFFQMQGDIYLNFQMSDRLSLYYDTGLSTRYELFGTAYILPDNGYVRVGRFVPTYGWKYDDHTMFARDELGFFPPNHTDVGIEGGWYPGRFAIHAAVLNGNRGNTLDNNRDLAAVARAAWRFHVAGTGVVLGASGYHNHLADGDHDAGGGFASLSWKGFTWVGEGDLYRIDPIGEGHRTGLAVSNEFAYLIRRGLEAKATYDFWDPDWNRETGAKWRAGGGVQVFPSPFLVLEGLARWTSFDNGSELSGDDYIETVLQFHFLY